VALADALDDLMKGPVKAPSKQCAVGFVLDQMSEDEQGKLAQLIDESSIPATRIAKVLQDNGFDIQYSSINRHRNRKKAQGCTCP
jgi:hypothetical protein